MTMTISVRDFRGCARADLEAAPVALLCGLNAAGKSSVALAVAAALTGNALPVAGLRPTAAGALVRTGANSGSVEVTSADGTVRVEWPAARSQTTGRPPQASEYATGLRSLVAMPPKDRLRVLSEYLHAEPTREDLGAALDDAGLPGAQVLDTVWPTIEASGWDATVASRRERGQQYKGAWRQATGANWGSRVASSWRPDLADLDRDELIRDVGNAKAERDRAVSAAAVSAAERSRLEEEADLYDARQGALERLTARVNEYAGAYHQVQELRAKLPPADKVVSFPCPHCGGPLVFDRVSLVETRVEKAPAVGVNNAELNKRRDAIAEADGKLSRANADLSQARREMAQAEIAVRDSLDARHRLDQWPRAVETGLNREAIEARLADAEKRLADYNTKAEADRLHALITGNEIVIDLLGPEGLRAAKLARVLDVFGGTLDALAGPAGWLGVRLDAAGSITYAGRPYDLLSSSEQYRVRVLLAAAMAEIDGSALVIFDGADILDPPSRGGLFALIEALRMPALVCSTLRRDHVPDLAAVGAGNSYWLAGGVVEPIAARKAA
jgi:hypothetical protein